MLRRSAIIIAAILIAPLAGVLAEDDPKKDPRKDPVRLELRNAPLSAVLRSLADRSHRTLVLREDVAERVSLSFTEMSADEAFDQLLKLYGYRKEVDGARTIVTRHVAEIGSTTTASDDPQGRLYLLAHIAAPDAVAGLASATEGRAAIDVLPGDRELLLVARPLVHELARAWLDEADRPRFETRAFKLAHRTIAGVDSASAASSDPVARDVTRLLSPAGKLAADLAQNALVVRDERPVLDAVARRIAALDRAPRHVTIEVAAIEVSPGLDLRGFAPTNDLPAAFANEARAGLMACQATEEGTLDTAIDALTDDVVPREVGVLFGRASGTCEERKAMPVSIEGLPAIEVIARPATGGVDLAVRVGGIEGRVRARPGRPVALRGIVKTEKWTGGWSPSRTELVLVLVASVAGGADAPREAPAVVAPPRAAASAGRDRLPELSSPEEWHKASAPK